MSTDSAAVSSTLSEVRARLVWWRASALIASEQLGRWITETSTASLAPVYAAWSQHQSLIVALVEDRYPVIPDVAEIDLEAETDAARRDLADLAGRLGTAHDDAARLHAFIDVVVEPMIAAAHDWAAATPAAVDAPTHRLIATLRAGLERDRAEAAALTAGL